MHIFPPAVLVTKRLVVRALTYDDIPLICPRITAACVADMSPSDSDFRKPDELATFVGHARVILRNGERIGLIFAGARTLAFGMWITPEHRRQGYASEAITAFLADPPFRIRYAGCFDDNIASRKIIERNGFAEIGQQSIKSPFCPMPRVAIFFDRPEDIGPLRLIALIVAALKRFFSPRLARAMKSLSAMVQR
jgi:hypothetical protein